MVLSPDELSDNWCDSFFNDKLFEELCSTDISPSLPPMKKDEMEKWANYFVDDDWYKENKKWDISPSFPPSGLSPNLQGSSNGQHLLQDSLKRFEQNANAGPQVIPDKSIPPVLFAQSGPKTLAMHRGKKLQDTADNLEVGVSILPQKHRRVENISLPHHRRNSPPISSQSNHTESDQWLGKYPTNEVINMPQGRAFESHKLKATYSMISGETPMPDALANTSQPLQNGMPCEDRCETSTKRKSREKETHFEEQPTEIQSNNPVRQVIVETIEGDNIPNAITDHNVVDHPTHMAAQPSLGSISTQPSRSFSSIENTKLSFDNLIALPLEVLSNPEKETSMIEALTILKENLPLFSEEQGDQILGLSLDFYLLVCSWREWSSKFQKHSQQSSTETEKIRDLVENSGRDEECLKVRYEELENNEKELMKQLEAVQKEKAEIAEQRIEKSKQTKDLMEKEARRNKEERLMKIATAKLNNLSVQWAKLQSFFI